jgi:hypothetical protein
MSLAVSVGLLAYLKSEDPEGAEWLRQELKAVNRILASNRLPAHIEPESLPPILDRVSVGSMHYSWIHYLRRAVAYALRAPDRFRPQKGDEEPTEDEMYDRVLCSSESHIICHSDCEGFYVPIDFPEPLYDELNDDDEGVIPGGILGSSQGGLRELVLVAPLLDIRLSGGQLRDKEALKICREREGEHPHAIARKAWLTIFERLWQSVEFKSAVVFG